jgi:hypothetical protein
MYLALLPLVGPYIYVLTQVGSPLNISTTLPNPPASLQPIHHPKSFHIRHTPNIHHLQTTTMPSNPFSHLTGICSISSDTASIKTTSSRTRLLQYDSAISAYSTIGDKTETTLSPGEKQKIRQQDRISMQALAMHAAMR